MSARVMNPAMMTEMSRNLGGGVGGGRVIPSRAALARVRRDLFGPVDHAAARALADRELKAQSILDSERWGFDFHLEIPRGNSKYDWEVIGPQEIIPEPYALRGMPYLRKQTPETPRKSPQKSLNIRRTPIVPRRIDLSPGSTERTPPQEPRVPKIGDNTNADDFVSENFRKKSCVTNQEPTTPVVSVAAKKQSIITDFMNIRKRSLNGSTKKPRKGIVEPPEKMTRNAGQIRS